jgi:hypothetical protein
LEGASRPSEHQGLYVVQIKQNNIFGSNNFLADKNKMCNFANYYVFRSSLQNYNIAK